MYPAKWFNKNSYQQSKIIFGLIRVKLEKTLLFLFIHKDLDFIIYIS